MDLREKRGIQEGILGTSTFPGMRNLIGKISNLGKLMIKKAQVT
jgi:hypothetical protein